MTFTRNSSGNTQGRLGTGGRREGGCGWGGDTWMGEGHFIIINIVLNVHRNHKAC